MVVSMEFLFLVSVDRVVIKLYLFILRGIICGRDWDRDKSKNKEVVMICLEVEFINILE